MELIRLVVGFDQREAIAYHVFVQSVIQNSNNPSSFYPLSKKAISFTEVPPFSVALGFGVRGLTQPVPSQSTQLTGL